MHEIHRFLAAAIAACALPAGAFATDYDLPAFLARVEQYNSAITGARLELESAEQSVRQARSALLPTVAAQGSYTRNLEDVFETTAVAVDAGAAGITPLIFLPVDSNKDNEIGLGIGVSQNVFDASARAGLEKARLARLVRAEAFEVTRRGVLTGAKKTYARALLTAQVAAVMASSEKMAEEAYRDISRKHSVGLAKELDMLMAEVDWKSSVPKTAGAVKDAALAMMALKRLAGIAQAEDVRLAALPDELPPLPEAKAMGAVLSARPDYRIELISSELADATRRAAYASFLPSVTASFSYGYGGAGDGSSLATYDGSSGSIGLTISLPLYTGGYRASLAESARIEQLKQALSLQDALVAIEGDLEEIMMRLRTASQTIASAGLVVETAERAAGLAKSAFANGMATQLSVTEAASRLEQARLGFLNAQFEYRMAYYDWEQASGSAY